MVMQVVAKISGGEGSWLAARTWLDRGGEGEFSMLFTDTLIEDQDTYRFLIAAAANLTGRKLPAGFLPEISDFPAWEDRPAYKAYVTTLAVKTRELIPELAWIADGRDPFDVFRDERFLGNSSADPCSKHLKRQLADRWLREHKDPAATAVIVGIDHEEIERFEGNRSQGRSGLRARMAEKGWTFIAPLTERPWLSPEDRRHVVSNAGLWRQRLSMLGFSHSNCGGFCCKGGHGHFRLMLRAFPERYAFVEREEAAIRDLLGNVSMMTDRHGGQKSPLTLADFRKRAPGEFELQGACHGACMFGDDEAEVAP